MDDLLDMITTDESPSQISDKIKEVLFAKSAERIESQRPNISASMFDEPENEVEEEPEPTEESEE